MSADSFHACTDRAIVNKTHNRGSFAAAAGAGGHGGGAAGAAAGAGAGGIGGKKRGNTDFPPVGAKNAPSIRRVKLTRVQHYRNYTQ